MNSGDRLRANQPKGVIASAAVRKGNAEKMAQTVLNAGHKKCVRCNVDQSLVEFFRDKRQYDGYHRDCKSCSKARSVAWKLKNKERNKKTLATYYATHRDAALERSRRRYQEKKIDHIAKCREWAVKHPDEVKSIKQRWKATHPEQVRQYVEQLSDSYVRALIRAGGAAINAPPELIELKREQLILWRLARELKQAATKGSK